MKALTFHGKEIIRHETVADPGIEQPTDAIVKVNLAAICGSDLHPYHEREKGLDHGTVMGHEFTGEIVEVGQNVSRLLPGTHVLSPFTSNCGTCFFCRQGLTSRCVKGELFGWVQNGKGLHGSQAEYVRVPLSESTLLPVPETVLPEEALLLGDVLSTGYFCADRADIEPGGTAAVVGCGPVGLMAIIGARELGADAIYAIDAIPERLRLAQQFGATAVNYKEQDPVALLRENTDGRGADAVLEAVGSPAAGRLAFDLIREGGTISTAGVHTEAQLAFSPVEAYDKNITYRIGRCPARTYMEQLLPLVVAQKYNLVTVISHRLPLLQGVEAYGIFDKKQDGCTKVVLKP